MFTICARFRLRFAAAYGLIALAGQLAADPPSALPLPESPPPPPAQAPAPGGVKPARDGEMTPAEAMSLQKQIAELERAGHKHLISGELSEAAEVLRSVRGLRLHFVPEEHWLIRTIDIQTAEMERLENLPAEQRKTVVETIAAWKELTSQLTAATGPAAIGRMTELLETLSKAAGEESFYSVEFRCQLSQALLSSQKFAECREFASGAVILTSRLLGENHPWHAGALSILAATDSNLGRWEDARREAALALRANERLWGGSAPPCGMNLIALAWAEIHQKDFEAAHRHADRAVSILARYQEQDPINYVTARSHVTRALVELNRNEEAKEEFSKLIAFLDRHPQVPLPYRRGILGQYAGLLNRMGIKQELGEIQKRIAELDASAAAVR